MDEPLDEQYLSWLYRQVSSIKARNPSRTYWSLLRQLYTTEFVWLVPNDDNRVEDGRDLRYEFMHENQLDNVDQGWMNLGCSVLEMIIGLSRRLAFEAEGEPRDWFWILVRNLKLERYNDSYFTDQHHGIVNDILDTLIWRKYSYNGDGGLFPLEEPAEDQRNIEIWYQLSAYLLEHE